MRRIQCIRVGRTGRRKRRSTRALWRAAKSQSDPEAALRAYERERLPVTANVVRTNRQFPPDFINIKVEQLVGDKPSDDLNKYITQDELRAMSEDYKRIAGFALSNVDDRRQQPPPDSVDASRAPNP